MPPCRPCSRPPSGPSSRSASPAPRIRLPLRRSVAPRPDSAHPLCTPKALGPLRIGNRGRQAAVRSFRSGRAAVGRFAGAVNGRNARARSQARPGIGDPESRSGSSRGLEGIWRGAARPSAAQALRSTCWIVAPSAWAATSGRSCGGAAAATVFGRARRPRRLLRLRPTGRDADGSVHVAPEERGPER